MGGWRRPERAAVSIRAGRATSTQSREMFSWTRKRPTNRSGADPRTADQESSALGVLQQAIWQHQEVLQNHRPGQEETLLSIAGMYESCLLVFTERGSPQEWARVNGLY
jgi:hypothetical protein